jgi:hypothetical protein
MASRHVASALIILVVAYSITFFVSSTVYVSVLLFLLLLPLNYRLPPGFLSFSISKSLATESLRAKFGWRLVGLGLFFLALRGIAVMIESMARSLVNFVSHAHSIRVSWIVAIELIGFYMVYGSRFLMSSWNKVCIRF